MMRPIGLLATVVVFGICVARPGAIRTAPSQSIGIFVGSADVGTPSTVGPGTAVYDAAARTYRVTGGGENMWASADHFRYVWAKASGDVRIDATIDWVATFPADGTPDPHRKAVLVFRQTLDSDSVYADAATHGDGLTSLQWRETKGSVTNEVQTSLVGPSRLRLEKRGNYVSMSVADRDGDFRPAGGAARVDFTGEFYVGIGVSAHNTGRLETAVFSDVSVARPPATTGRTRRLTTVETISLRSRDRRAAYVVAQPGRIETPVWFPDDTNTIYFNDGGQLRRVQAEPPGTPPNPTRLSVPQRFETGPIARVGADYGVTADGSTWAVTEVSAMPGAGPRIRTVPSTGGSAVATAIAAPARFGSWSPDGRTLLYTADRNGNLDVYCAPVSGGPETRLTSDAAVDEAPSFSPDGQFIYFTSTRSGSMQVWRMRADGTSPAAVTQDPDVENWFPRVAPNGQSLVFLTAARGSGARPADTDVSLRVMNLQTRAVTTIARLFGGDGTINGASWSPDSQYLAFISYQIVPE